MQLIKIEHGMSLSEVLNSKSTINPWMTVEQDHMLGNSIILLMDIDNIHSRAIFVMGRMQTERVKVKAVNVENTPIAKAA